MSLDASQLTIDVKPDAVRPIAASRRELFRLAAGAGILSAIPVSLAQSGGGSGPTGLDKYRLVHDSTFGFTSSMKSKFDSLGWRGFLDWQLNPDAIDETAVDARLAGYTTLKMPVADLLTIPKGGPNPTSELIDAAILRQIYSDRQLFERMVTFWTDLFNIDIQKVGSLKTVHDREVIRPYALTSYYDLLIWNAHSPAMLRYLDNDASVKAHPNQNYARELMELHTLGVDGGYTQQDVVEVARCFTGWRWVRDAKSADHGKFWFDAKNHDDGAKTVLGNTIPAKGGIADGRMVLDILAHHPATYKRISTRLCTWLLGYAPTQSLVNSVVAKATSTNWDTKELIRVILGSASVVRGQSLKLKRPLEFIESAIRAVNGDVTNIARVASVAGQAGEIPFEWSPPNGYPDALAYWGELLLPRWNAAFWLMRNELGTTVNIDALVAGETTPTGIANRIDLTLYGGEMPSSDKQLVTTFLKSSSTPAKLAAEAFGLAMALPGFQWY